MATSSLRLPHSLLHPLAVALLTFGLGAAAPAASAAHREVTPDRAATSKPADRSEGIRQQRGLNFSVPMRRNDITLLTLGPVKRWAP